MIKLLVANKNPIFRQGIRSYLLNDSGVKVVGEAAGKRQIFLKTTELKPDILTFDAGADFTEVRNFFHSFRKEFTGIRVIYFLQKNEAHFCKKMLKLGADAYLSDFDTKEHLMEGIDQIMMKETYVSKSIQAAIIDNCLPKFKQKLKLQELTEREKEILTMISNELITKEIANNLFISTHTVESHRKKLLLKTHARNTAGLVKYAIENGLT